MNLWLIGSYGLGFRGLVFVEIVQGLGPGFWGVLASFAFAFAFWSLVSGLWAPGCGLWFALGSRNCIGFGSGALSESFERVLFLAFHLLIFFKNLKQFTTRMGWAGGKAGAAGLGGCL